MTATPYEEVRQLVTTLVATEKSNGMLATSESITEKIRAIVTMFGSMRGTDFTAHIDTEALQRDIESSLNVFMASANVMSDDSDHEPWLDVAKASIDPRFWSRYRQYQLSSSMPPAAVEKLDDITDLILGRLESPKRPGAWDRRGLVAGQVQSGKTGNYIGLTCKAIDSGYKLVVILAGIHNNLRAQTQARVDEGVLGFSTEHAFRADSASHSLIGVGNLGFLHVNSFTTRKENGDFNLKVAESIGVAVGGADPVVLVVKKNKSVLTNILRWATGLGGAVDPVTGRKIVQNVPLLVIDDEADQASIDTNGPQRGEGDEYDPPVINGLIRELLDKFQQSAYVGYTATPFANIFVDPEVEHETAGRSLFPQSFIVSLPAPSNYVGPSRVFGLKEDVTRNIDPREPLPMVRSVKDWESWIPDVHKKELIPGPLPASLREAILAFILTVGVRQWRGQTTKHNSMLVHVTRFTAVQKHVRQLVQEELERLQRRFRQADPNDDADWARARRLFEDDYLASAQEFALADDLSDQIGNMPTWEQLAAVLPRASELIEAREVNGTVKDSLDYVDHPDGLNIIAVGGAKLSRGLTLEGLSISYYLAGTRMYDTLMQMGRWFGYRAGYLDLCRLYTTDELKRRYALVTGAAEELYREFDYMVALGSSPREFGLRVQQHPDGLMVTAPNKMRNAQLLSMSFAGSLSETVLFRTDEAARDRNWKALADLVAALPAPTTDAVAGAGEGYVWKDVPSSVVTDFLNSYTPHPDAYKVQPAPLRDYIRARNADRPAELTDWWVMLADSRAADATTTTVGPLTLRLTVRGQHPTQKVPDDSERFPIRRLVSPPHERIDIAPGSPEYDAAVTLTANMWADSPRKDLNAKEAPTEPAGVACRKVRAKERGVLLLYPLDPARGPAEKTEGAPYVGFALSFPGSDRAKPVDYQVAKDLWLRLTGSSPTLSAVEDESDAVAVP